MAGESGDHHLMECAIEVAVPAAVEPEAGDLSKQPLPALDGLGSPTALVNHDGTQTAAYTYDPYGGTTATAVNGSGAKDIQIYGYAGGFDDPTSTLVHYGERWYDPVTGRWTQQDSLETVADPTSANRYEYAAGNPINYVDPTGRHFGDGTIADYAGDGAGIGAAVGGFGGAIYGCGMGAAAGAAAGGVGAIPGCLVGGALGLVGGATSFAALGSAVGGTIGIAVELNE